MWNLESNLSANLANLGTVYLFPNNWLANRYTVPLNSDAEALNTIRNHLEHKYLKVHDWPWTSERDADAIHDSLRDSLAYSVTRGDLEAKSLRLFKLVRAGLIYLSLAVHREEQLRAKQRGDGMVMPMELNTWPDDWKR